AERQSVRQAGRQAGRQASRQTDKQEDRHKAKSDTAVYSLVEHDLVDITIDMMWYQC
ncbi:hypothetical protein DPMN_030254, partial [Dreissena polymorpha]